MHSIASSAADAAPATPATRQATASTGLRMKDEGGRMNCRLPCIHVFILHPSTFIFIIQSKLVETFHARAATATPRRRHSGFMLVQSSSRGDNSVGDLGPCLPAQQPARRPESMRMHRGSEIDASYLRSRPQSLRLVGAGGTPGMMPYGSAHIRLYTARLSVSRNVSNAMKSVSVSSNSRRWLFANAFAREVLPLPIRDETRNVCVLVTDPVFVKMFHDGHGGEDARQIIVGPGRHHENRVKNRPRTHAGTRAKRKIAKMPGVARTEPMSNPRDDVRGAQEEHEDECPDNMNTATACRALCPIKLYRISYARRCGAQIIRRLGEPAAFPTAYTLCEVRFGKGDQGIVCTSRTRAIR